MFLVVFFDCYGYLLESSCVVKPLGQMLLFVDSMMDPNQLSTKHDN